MITASEARKMAGPTLGEKIEALGETIKTLAEKGDRKCRTGWQHKDDDDLWVQGGYEKSDDWWEAKKRLEELGYTVTFHYEEKQFVDMYTVVEW